MTLCSFQKYIVFYGCQVVNYYLATTISPNFPIFPSTLAPFSQILNELKIFTGQMYTEMNLEFLFT